METSFLTTKRAILVCEVAGSAVGSAIGPEGNLSAPLSEPELALLEEAIANFRAGKYGVTDDPEELRQGEIGRDKIFRFWRKEEP